MKMGVDHVGRKGRFDAGNRLFSALFAAGMVVSFPAEGFAKPEIMWNGGHIVNSTMMDKINCGNLQSAAAHYFGNDLVDKGLTKWIVFLDKDGGNCSELFYGDKPENAIGKINEFNVLPGEDFMWTFVFWRLEKSTRPPENVVLRVETLQESAGYARDILSGIGGWVGKNFSTSPKETSADSEKPQPLQFHAVPQGTDLYAASVGTKLKMNTWYRVLVSRGDDQAGVSSSTRDSGLWSVSGSSTLVSIGTNFINGKATKLTLTAVAAGVSHAPRREATNVAYFRGDAYLAAQYSLATFSVRGACPCRWFNKERQALTPMELRLLNRGNYYTLGAAVGVAPGLDDVILGPVISFNFPLQIMGGVHWSYVDVNPVPADTAKRWRGAHPFVGLAVPLW